MAVTAQIDRKTIENIVRQIVLQQAGGNGRSARYTPNLVVSISARHVHLTDEHVEILFGPGHQLTPMKDLYQDGFYAAEETVMVVGPRRRMLPTVLVAYEREAFYSRFDPLLRLTFDRNVRSRIYPELASLYEDREMRFLAPGHFIFEVKFYLHLPRWVGDVVRRFDLQRQAFSKYSTGIEIHRVDQKHLRGAGHTVEFPDVVPLRAGAFA